LYSKLDDRYARNPKFPAAAAAALAAAPKTWRGLDADDITLMLQGGHAGLMALSSGDGTDGFLTEAMIRTFPQLKPRVLAALQLPVLGRPALVHARGDECASPHCLSRHPWPDDVQFQFVIHDYRQWNKGRRRYRLDVAKDGERKDTALRLAMYARDRGHCRYCGRFGAFATRKGDGWLQVTGVAQMDHVTDAAGGLQNVVAGCGPCNNAKQRRTPEEAGLKLLTLAEMWQQFPTFREWAPTDKRVINWTTGHTDLMAAWDAEARQTTPITPADHITDQHHTTDHDQNPSHDPPVITDHDPAAGDDHQPAHNKPHQPADVMPAYPSTGHGRRRDPDSGPPTDIWLGSGLPVTPHPAHQASRASPGRHIPEELWPPGTSTTRPAKTQQRTGDH
jgi:5-methylcytosine-specific restriction endonuclease McrA